MAGRTVETSPQVYARIGGMLYLIIIVAVPQPSGCEIEPNPTPRNALCPCGSGTKYKRCCGKAAPPVLNMAA